MNLKNLPTDFDRAALETLTPREAAFVLDPEVMTDPKAAAIRAGYAPSSARCHAYTWRKQLMYFILPLHQERIKHTQVTTGITPDRIKNEIANIAFANEADYYDTVDVDGDTIKVLKDVTRMPEPMQRAIKKVEFETIVAADGTQFQRLLKIELYDKLKALSELAEIFGLKDPKTRNPDDQLSEEQKFAEGMSSEALDQMAAIMEAEHKRLKAHASKKRDRQALPGIAKRIDKE